MCLDDDCQRLTRRDFIARSTALTVGGLATGVSRAEAEPGGPVAGPLPFLAAALRDTRIAHGPATFMSDGASIRAHVARPKRATPQRIVLVNHGNPGIPEDVRAALAHLAQLGYAAITYDSDTRSGAPSGQIARPPDFYRSDTFARQILRDNAAATAFLREQPFVVREDEVALLGFCGGGYSVLRHATQTSGVRAVVALYAAPAFPPERTNAADPRPNLDSFIAQVRSPVQFHYGTRDPLIPLALVEHFRDTMRAADAERQLFLYDDAGHAFCDYTDEAAYHEAAARLAYDRIDRFLAAHYPA